MNTHNSKFWAAVGFVMGSLMAAGGELSSPADALLGGVIQSIVWFGVSTLILRSKKFDPVEEPVTQEVQRLSWPRKLIGGFFFIGGIASILGFAFRADGASLGAGIFNLIIGTPLFWPIARGWLNKIPFPQK
jgi:hypothetical protein